MKTLVLIGLGSFIGGICRYTISQWVQSRALSTFPYGTMVVNIAGCLLIGILFAWSDRTGMSADWRLFMATGICGGFTTFSAFSHETVAMLRDGQFTYAAAYIFGSLILGLLATLGGYVLVKLIG